MGPIAILLWTVGLPAALVILYLAHVGLHTLIEKRKFKAFIGSDRTAAIPCADTAIRNGTAALQREAIRYTKCWVRLTEEPFVHLGT